METFFQALIPSLAVGSLYALIALGYTMVYGILKFINFAHGDVFVLGAWLSLTAAWCAGYHPSGEPREIGSWVLVAIGAVFALAVLVWAFDRFLRPAIPTRWASRLPLKGGEAVTLGLVGAWGGVCVGLVLVARAMHTHLPASAQFLTGGLILVIAMLACGLVGFVLERLAYKPLRSAPRLNVLITAIGVSLFLQNIGQLDWMFSTQPVGMPVLITQETVFSIAGVGVGWIDVLGAGTAVLLMIGLDWLVYRTKLGSAMRAVSFNPANAALMGIPVDRVISFTFVLGAMLAAAAGFLYAQKYPVIGQTATPVWVLLGLKAFVAAVIGGIGNIRGAMVGGLLIGFLEQFSKFYVSTQAADVYVFGLLILVLLVKPTGLFGAPDREKV